MTVRWPEIRAALIAIAIVLGLVDGAPWLPHPVRRVVLWPVAWVEPRLRVSQEWALYQSPGPDRYRMWIEVQGADRSWQLVYRAGDPEHAEDAPVIEHARVWGTWDPTDRPPGEYGAFCGWITRRALDAHADAVAARVRMERIAIARGGFVPSGTFRWTYIRTRGTP